MQSTHFVNVFVNNDSIVETIYIYNFFWQLGVWWSTISININKKFPFFQLDLSLITLPKNWSKLWVQIIVPMFTYVPMFNPSNERGLALQFWIINITYYIH